MARIPRPFYDHTETRSQVEINRDWIMQHLSGCKRFKEIKTDEFQMCSPLREDKEPSFTVNAEKGTYYDFSTGGGTLTELATRLNVDPPVFAGAGRSVVMPAQTAEDAPQRENQSNAQTLQAIWDAGSTAISEHPYIKKKGINPELLDWRLCTSGSYSGWLMIPALGPNGKLQAIQYISDGGKKRDSKGTDFKETIWPAGRDATITGKEKEVILCEGAATAATVKELRPAAAVFCTFGSSNMPATARRLKSAFVESDFIIAADSGKAGEKTYNEIIRGKQATASDAGRLPIDDALKAIPRKKKIVPDDPDYSENTDWNDIATEYGKDFAAAELDKCIKWEKLFRDILAQAAADQKLKVMTGDDLFATDDEPLEWVVKDLIPEGLTVLAGHPKKGKSFLALQMSLAVAGGESFMGMATKKGIVLHMALEDGARRTRERVKHLRGRAAASKALFAFNCPRFNENGLRELLNIIRDAEPALIVVDVWNAVKPPTSKATGKNAYEADHEAASVLNRLGTETHTAILMVHHLRKGAADSETMAEGLSGSMGLPAAASAILTLLRNDESQHGILCRSGRDYEDDSSIHLHFSRGQQHDGEPFGWRPATREEVDENSEPRNKNDAFILSTLKAEALKAEGSGLTMNQLASKVAGLMTKRTLYKRLRHLADTHEIRKTEDDTYQLAEAGGDYGATMRAYATRWQDVNLDIPAIIANGKAKAAAAAAAATEPQQLAVLDAAQGQPQKKESSTAEASASAVTPSAQDGGNVLANIGESIDID